MRSCRMGRLVARAAIRSCGIQSAVSPPSCALPLLRASFRMQEPRLVSLPHAMALTACGAGSCAFASKKRSKAARRHQHPAAHLDRPDSEHTPKVHFLPGLQPTSPSLHLSSSPNSSRLALASMSVKDAESAGFEVRDDPDRGRGIFLLFFFLLFSSRFFLPLLSDDVRYRLVCDARIQAR